MVNRYIYATIALALFITVLIFSLDPLVGAIGLRAIYRPLGASVGVMSLILIPFAIRYEQMMARGRLIYLLVVVIIGIVAATPISFILIVVGWFTGFVTGAMFVSAVVIMIGFGVVGVVLFILSFWYPKTKSITQAITILLLLYSAGYFIGIGATPAYAEAEMPSRLVHNDKQYFLYLHWGWLGDPDTLLLYECNSIGINCEIIYRAPTGYYRGKNLSIDVDDKTQIVGVNIDGQISPHELTENDVRYLCDFFKANSNDPFCINPHFQDRTTFTSMVQRTLGRINYATVRPLFKSAQTEEGADCLPPEEAFLNTKEKSITCNLQFPDNRPYYVSLYMTNDYTPFWYRLELIIPGLKND